MKQRSREYKSDLQAKLKHKLIYTNKINSDGTLDSYLDDDFYRCRTLADTAISKKKDKARSKSYKKYKKSRKKKFNKVRGQEI